MIPEYFTSAWHRWWEIKHQRLWNFFRLRGFFQSGTSCELDLAASHVISKDRSQAACAILFIASRLIFLSWDRVVVSEWVGRGNTPVRKRRKKQRKLGMLRDTLRVSTLVTRLSAGGRQWLCCRLTVLAWRSCCSTGGSHRPQQTAVSLNFCY